MKSTSVVVRQHKSNVVFTYLYGLFRNSDISLGNVSVGIIGSIQRFASAIPKPIIKNPNAKYSTFNAIVFGRSASHASWTSIIFPKPIPTTKEKTYSKQNAFSKIIRIASVYPLAGSFIPELIQSCSAKFPFAIYNGMTPDILHGLENMTYDLGFCSGQPSSELFEYYPVQKSYVGIVVPKGHELISKEAFTFRDITTYPQIFFTRTSPMRKLQEQIYKDYQISAAPACEAEEIEVILNMIEHGFGISVLPYLDIFKNRNVDVLPLSETKWESTFYAIRRRDGVRSQGEKTIWSQIIHNSKWDRLEF